MNRSTALLTLIVAALSFAFVALTIADASSITLTVGGPF